MNFASSPLRVLLSARYKAFSSCASHFPVNHECLLKTLHSHMSPSCMESASYDCHIFLNEWKCTY